jgi:antitoxin component YwqK of YwqJK toxin-antitoxin module
MLRYNLILVAALTLSLNTIAQSLLPDTTWNQLDPSGKKQGWWKRYYPDGIIMYTGFFVNDSPRGTLKRYFENGKRKAIMQFSDDGKSSYARLFYMNGELAAEGKYLGTLKDSTWNYYSYYTRTLSLVENYRDGHKSGPVMKYYDNGTVAESVEWNSDVKNGKWFQYFEDGSLRLSSFYLNDKINGPYLVYTAPGILAIDGKYINGNMDGTWKFYNVNGNLEFELKYDNGTALNDSVLEEKSKKFIEDLEKNLGTIPEPDLENVAPGGN